MPNTCPHCQSDVGYYEGPNGKDRCYNCFMEMADAPSEEEASRNIEPNRPVKDKAVASPASTKAKDKAEDSPAKQEKVPPTPKERTEAVQAEAEKEAAKVGSATPVKDKHVPSPAKAKTKG